MKTQSAKPLEIERSWFIVDAEDLVLGRMATRVASVLRGKHKTIFTPNVDTGDFVVVINAAKVRVTGKKETDKLYWHYTGYQGGAKSTSVEKQRKEHPDRLITHAVRGMLPKGPLGRRMLKKLKVYESTNHPHAAQKPETLKI
ncbi:MAG: 50S ribosomal protein L13 [Deltaproteobacteria bacterium]|nr:50S ribosomal protein L13 [Deltaproteobacteria bacterium]